jgi:hypothetical protein
MGKRRLIDANALLREMRYSGRAAYMLVLAAPTIDPETLRPVSEWELNPYRFSCEHFRCKKCHHIDCVADKYCGECGSKMKNAGVKPEDMPIPTETIQKTTQVLSGLHCEEEKKYVSTEKNNDRYTGWELLAGS